MSRQQKYIVKVYVGCLGSKIRILDILRMNLEKNIRQRINKISLTLKRGKQLFIQLKIYFIQKTNKMLLKYISYERPMKV
jgi:hypothetical protein